MRKHQRQLSQRVRRVRLELCLLARHLPEEYATNVSLPGTFPRDSATDVSLPPGADRVRDGDCCGDLCNTCDYGSIVDDVCPLVHGNRRRCAVPAFKVGHPSLKPSMEQRPAAVEQPSIGSGLLGDGATDDGLIIKEEELASSQDTPATTSCYTSGSEFASIPRVHWSHLTQELVRDHVIRRCPLIITGLAPTGSPRWSFQRLGEECGSARVDLANHYRVPLEHIDTHWPALLRPLVDRYLHPWSVTSLLHELDRKWDVGGILERFMHEDLYRGSYGSLGDYVWPPTLRSLPLEQLGCEPLITAALKVQTLLQRSFFQGASFWTFGRSPSGRPYVPEPGRPPLRPGYGWEAFVAPNATRAYPMHQHGTLNENLIVVLSGTKQAFVFPPSADGDLRERPEVATSEYGDRIFTSRPEELVSTVAGAAVRLVPERRCTFRPTPSTSSRILAM